MIETALAVGLWLGATIVLTFTVLGAVAFVRRFW